MRRGTKAGSQTVQMCDRWLQHTALGWYEKNKVILEVGKRVKSSMRASSFTLAFTDSGIQENEGTLVYSDNLASDKDCKIIILEGYTSLGG